MNKNNGKCSILDKILKYRNFLVGVKAIKDSNMKSNHREPTKGSFLELNYLHTLHPN